MRAGILTRDGLAAVMMLAVAAGGLESVRAGGPEQHGEKIEFTEAPDTQNSTVVSNLGKMSTDETSFNQVKEDLFRPFSSLDPRNAVTMEDFMNGQLPPPPKPTQGQMSKRQQELLDEKRNWAFTAFEELYSPNDEMEKKMFGIKDYGADGREMKAVSVVDKYYESLEARNASATNYTAEEARAKFINENGFDPMGKTFQTGDPFMRKMLGIETTGLPGDKSDGKDLPGGAGKGELVLGSPEEVRMKAKQLEAMKQNILGPEADKLRLTGNTLVDNAMMQNGNKGQQGLMNQQLFDDSELRKKSANPFVAADPTANALHSHINDDLTAKALGLPNQTLTRSNSVTRPNATAQSIQAEWDPFGANRPKPKF